MTCPRCHRDAAEWQEATSAFASADYYRCPACGHAWTVSRDAAQRITDVTYRASENVVRGVGRQAS